MIGSGAYKLSTELDCHVYLVEGDDYLAMIDCGMNNHPDRIANNIVNDGLDINKLKYILLTHAHPDHVGGAAYFKEKYNVQVVCSQYEADVLSAGAGQFYKLNVDIPESKQWFDMPKMEADRIISDHDMIGLGLIDIEAIITPGHTKGSVCYKVNVNDENMLFSGDTIFYKGFISVLPPPFTDLNDYPEGLAKLENLNISGLFPSHLMWVLQGGQNFIDSAINSFRHLKMPVIKPFS